MRTTSIDCYHAIKESGLLQGLRFKVYDCLFHHGPMTQTECYQYLGGSHQSIAPRFAELLKFGVIHEVQIRACSVTGRNCIAWDVSGNVAVKPLERETRAQKIVRLEREIERLESENKHLRSLEHQNKPKNPAQLGFLGF